MMTLLIVLAILGVIVALMYNFLIAKKNEVDNIYGGIDALFKNRYNLIPNLVQSVKQYVTHERETLEKITQYRTQAMEAKSSDETLELNNKLGSMLGGVSVAMEEYPDLKANENFLHLQKSLNEIEAQISAARRAYNQAVTDYNNAIEMFPTNILAKYMKYQRKGVFEVSEETQKDNPDVKDIFKSS